MIIPELRLCVASETAEGLVLGGHEPIDASTARRVVEASGADVEVARDLIMGVALRPNVIPVLVARALGGGR